MDKSDTAAAKDEGTALTHLPDWAIALASKHRPNWVLPVCDHCDNEVWPCETRMAWEEAAAALEALEEARRRGDGYKGESEVSFARARRAEKALEEAQGTIETLLHERNEREFERDEAQGKLERLRFEHVKPYKPHRYPCKVCAILRGSKEGE